MKELEERKVLCKFVRLRDEEAFWMSERTDSLINILSAD